MTTMLPLSRVISIVFFTFVLLCVTVVFEDVEIFNLKPFKHVTSALFLRNSTGTLRRRPNGGASAFKGRGNRRPSAALDSINNETVVEEFSTTADDGAIASATKNESEVESLQQDSSARNESTMTSLNEGPVINMTASKGNETRNDNNDASVSVDEESIGLNGDWPQQVQQQDDNNNNTTYTVIIRSGGEMGNHLSRMAYGYAMNWMLQEDYNISTNILLEHEGDHAWKAAEVSLKTCFPNFRQLDFGAANTHEFRELETLQEQWLGKEHNSLLYSDNNCQDEACIRMRLGAMVDAIQNNTTTTMAKPSTSSSSSQKAAIQLPFFVAHTFGSLGYINDRYQERLKALFAFDEAKCCSKRSPGNETVLHIRGFLSEMGRHGKTFGFEELSPNKTVTELLLHHHVVPDRKIAVLGRIKSHAQPYVDLMNANGMEARFVETETGEQSFCYLMSAQEDLIGIAMSTFAIWASYWGNATTARLYSIKSPHRTDHFGDDGYFFHYNFTLNQALQDKIRFELYNSEEQDENDKEQS